MTSLVKDRLIAAVCLFIAVVRAQAQNRGVYPLGMSAMNSGLTPAAGFTYSNQLSTMRAMRPRTTPGTLWRPEAMLSSWT